MKVLAVTSEIYPLVKTGGLADVAGALPLALAREGVRVRSLVPGYPAVLAALEKAENVHAYDNLHGGPARLLEARAGKLELFVLDAPHLYRREGNPYVDDAGLDWKDNALRFGALAKAAADIGKGLVPDYRPALVHAHDWQTGLTPAYLRGGPATVITVHNLAFQGLFPPALADALELPPAIRTMEGVEFPRPHRIPQGGTLFRKRHHHRLPDLCGGDLHAGRRHGARRPAARARPGLTGICNGIDGFSL